MTRTTFRRTRFATLIASVAASAFLAACSADSPLAPEMQRSNGLLSSTVGGLVKTLTLVNALERDSALMQPIVRSFTFTRSGGKIEIPETGLRVDIPTDAIPGSTLTITVTALPGKSVAYDFQPHGTQFKKALTFRQDLEGTSWDHSDFRGTLNGGYFKDAAQLDLLSGVAALDELFPITIKTHEVRFDINHFSGYMVSSGRRGATSDAF